MRYHLVSTVHTIEGDSVCEYGIQPKSGHPIFNISVEKCEIEKLVSLLNQEELEECHLEEVVEDWLIYQN